MKVFRSLRSRIGLRFFLFRDEKIIRIRNTSPMLWKDLLYNSKIKKRLYNLIRVPEQGVER